MDYIDQTQDQPQSNLFLGLLKGDFMINYSEFYNGDRKAIVTLINTHWDQSFNKWEVTMYINDRIIEKRTISSENLAENIAEAAAAFGALRRREVLGKIIQIGRAHV